jgi:adhesin/invasin
MSRRPVALPLSLTFAALGSACGGDLTLPNEGEPATVAIIRGNLQNGTVGEALGDSLVLEVSDGFGNPVEGVTVTWSAQVGGSVDPVETATTADGRAGTQRILGTQPSTYVTTATIEGIAEKVTFTSTGLVARLVITSEIPAIAVSGVPLSPQPTLRLEDLDGTPIAREVEVTVAILSGGEGGSLEGATTVTSNASGEVAFTDLAISIGSGSPGARRLIFSAEDFAPATTGPIALGVGAPASIELAAGDDQTATVGEAVAVPPAVLVRDADDNPLSGIPVTFSVTGGGGSVSGSPSVTGADGIAAVGEWRLGPAAGENTLQAAVVGQDLSGGPVVFSATGEAGGVSADESSVAAAPATISASSGSSSSAITVTVRDAFGNPLPGVEVALAVTGTGNTLVQPTSPTNASGVATGRLSSTAVGSRTVSATAGGVAIAGTATVTVGPGSPTAANSSATVPGGTAGQTTNIEILLEDAFGNPAAGRASSIAVSISGANNVGSLQASDEGNGRYVASYNPVVAGNDLVDVRVGGAPVAGSPFTSAVVPGPVSPGASTAVVNWNFFSVDATVTARDAQGNPVGRGGDVVVVTLEGSAPVTATDLGNGTYTATVSSFGFPAVTITLNGSPISGSPFSP